MFPYYSPSVQQHRSQKRISPVNLNRISESEIMKISEYLQYLNLNRVQSAQQDSMVDSVKTELLINPKVNEQHVACYR